LFIFVPETKYDPAPSDKWAGFNVVIRWLPELVIGRIDRPFNVSRGLSWKAVTTEKTNEHLMI